MQYKTVTQSRIQIAGRVLAIVAMLLVVVPGAVFAQLGGSSAFEFIKIPTSARVAALGGSFVTLPDGDVSTVFQNPAAMNDSMHARLTVSYANLMGPVNTGTAGYVHRLKDVGYVFGGIQYVNYGSFARTDVYGNQQGEFIAHDASFNGGFARAFGNFRFGATFKLVVSEIDVYHSVGLGADFGGMWYHPRLQLGVGLTLRNIGGQVMRFSDASRSEMMPFDIQLGITKKIPHTPLRFTLLFTNLNKPVLFKADPTQSTTVDLSGNVVDKGPSVADQVFGHLIFAAEAIIAKRVELRLSYNHQRRVELSPETEGISISGFSFGVGAHINRFYFDYGYSAMHLASGLHMLTFSTYLNSFGKQF